MNKTRNLKKAVILSMMLAMSICLNIVENLIEIIPVPGSKIGISNVISLIVLYIYGFIPAFSLTVLRIVLVSLMLPGRFLNPVFFMSLVGAIFSVIVMFLVKKIRIFGVIGESIFGSIFHNIGQLLVGLSIIGKNLIMYFPIMLFAGIITGFLVGLLAKVFLETTKGWLKTTNKNTTNSQDLFFMKVKKIYINNELKKRYFNHKLI